MAIPLTKYSYKYPGRCWGRQMSDQNCVCGSVLEALRLLSEHESMSQVVRGSRVWYLTRKRAGDLGLGSSDAE